VDSKHEREYTARHKEIRNKLLQMAKDSNCACFHVSKIAADLGWDQRTVRSHLKILEIDKAGVFLDAEEKEFCTREGLALLVDKIGLIEKAPLRSEKAKPQSFKKCLKSEGGKDG